MAVVCWRSFILAIQEGCSREMGGLEVAAGLDVGIVLPPLVKGMKLGFLEST